MTLPDTHNLQIQMMSRLLRTSRHTWLLNTCGSSMSSWSRRGSRRYWSKLLITIGWNWIWVARWMEKNHSGDCQTSADCHLWYTTARGHFVGLKAAHARCFLKALTVLKLSQSKLLQSCINQALMLLNHPTGMQWDEKWAICRCRVSAWWWIETLEVALAAVNKVLN